MKKVNKAAVEATEHTEPIEDAGAAVDEYAIDTVNANGRLSTTYGRRVRAHIARESNDRDNRDVTDEPPPGWPA